MFCPNCQLPCGEQDLFCPHCGAPITVLAPKKGRHWVPILIMVFLCAVGIGLFFAKPRETPGGDMPWFQIDNGILYFSPSDYDGSSELRIPESIGGQTVTVLAEGCFENCTEITSVILPSTLQAIGADAFRGCTALRGMDIPDSVMFIGKNAFSGCSALEAVCLSDNLCTIGVGAFTDCHKLHYVYFLGLFADWHNLYSEFISPQTVVFADDGSFPQGGDAY